MADLKLVGAVAIKVRPDASRFKEETQKQVKKELAGVEAEVPVKAQLDSTEAKTDAKKLEKELEGKTVTWNVKLDHDSVRSAQKRLDSMLAPTKEIKIDLKNPESIAKAIADLEELASKAQVEMTMTQDEKGFKEVLAKIEEVRRQKLEIPISFDTDDATLDKWEADMRARIAELRSNEVEIPARSTIKFEYDENRASLEATLAEIERELAKFKEHSVYVQADKDSLLRARAAFLEALGSLPVQFKYDKNVKGLEKVMAEIDAEVAKTRQVEIETTLDPLNLAFTRARLEAELSEQTVRIEYDTNLASLKAAKAKIEALLHIDNTLHIETKLDEASLKVALNRINAKIATAETKAITPQVKPKISTADYVTTMAALKTLTKNQTVGIFVKLNNASVLLAAAKLTGLRAASRWTEEFAKSLGKLDRNLPIVAAVVVGLATLTSGFLSLTASAFSLGNGLGEVARMAGVLAPAMLLGLGAVMTVITGVFKDFGAAVNGDDKAIAKLTESGKKAAAEIRVHFQAIREIVSKNFWDKAGDAMLRFAETALPAVGDGLGKLATSLGGIFSGVLDSFTLLTKQSGVKVFFANLTRGFDIAQTGMASFMSGFNTLAVVGSTVFPRIGRAFEAWATRFDNWVQRLAADGTLNRWIDRGIQGLKDLFNAGGSLVKVWGNIGQSAQAAGALTLHSFSQMMDRLDKVTAGARFQRNMTNIFKGAREASDTFHKALGDLGPAMDVFSLTLKTTLSGAGAALGAFIANIGDVMSSPRLQVGMQAFLGGLKEMFEQLRPAAAPVAEILQTFGEILGAVARDSGPLFRSLFSQLAGVLTAAWHALEPFLPALVQIGTTIVDTLGPALEKASTSLIPAFATAVQKIGDGLIPVIEVMADFAVGAAEMLAGLPIPTLAGIVTGIVALNGAMAFAGVVVPIAVGALKAFGIAASITAIQTQLLIPVVGLVLAALTGLASAGVAALATSMHSSTPFTTQYAEALREDAKAAEELGHATDAAVKKTAIMNLVQSGAYDKAKQLGIGAKDLTDAVLKGGSAWDRVKGQLSAVNQTYDDNFEASQKANKGASTWGNTIKSTLTPAMAEENKLADELNQILDTNRDSRVAGQKEIETYAEAAAAAGIETGKEADAQKKLTIQLDRSTAAHGAAAAATATLTDEFSSGAAKIDAMRKTMELLVGTNAKQKAAETLGAYVSGFNDLKETVKPLAEEMKNLGDKAYGEKGFLNVAGGNKAVLQVNQALVQQVDNVWLGAKAAYDAARKQGDNATTAFKKAKDFIAAHKGDYDQLAKESGLSAAEVQGHWDAVFGKEWVLKVSLEGATEAAVIAEALLTSIGAKFDGKRFQAYLDANPAAALQAVTDAEGAAKSYVDHEWEAKLKALPKPAQDAIKALVGQTEEQWNRGDFEALLKVANEVPGLAEALQQIINGANADYQAIIYAAANNVSVERARQDIDAIAYARTAVINVVVGYTEEGRPPPGVAGRGLRIPAANGGILDQFGRGMHPGFGLPKYFANGGIERHVAQIQRGGGPVRIWAEPETRGEAYIPYAQAKRPRSLAILSQVAKDFGYSLTKATEYSNGGVTGRPTPSTHNTASVHIGQLVTADADEAVRKIRISQQDALAVAGISLNGA